VQLILAGKAHPQDLPGQALIKQWNDFIKRPEVQRHVVFLSDYDMQMAQELVQGIDLWINTPRRPWEACGTSGMKVLVNGGLNFSELDGWWAEAYSPQVGWAIGDGQEHGEDPALDALEAEAMYTLLEREVVPSSMNGPNGMPSKWLGVSARVWPAHTGILRRPHASRLHQTSLPARGLWLRPTRRK
jgi:starch phosphorylase